MCVLLTENMILCRYAKVIRKVEYLKCRKSNLNFDVLNIMFNLKLISYVLSDHV